MNFQRKFQTLKPLFEERLDDEFDTADEVGMGGHSDIAQFREGLDREHWGGHAFEEGPIYAPDSEEARVTLARFSQVFEHFVDDYPVIVNALADQGDLERLNEILNWAYGIAEVYGVLSEA